MRVVRTPSPPRPAPRGDEARERLLAAALEIFGNKNLEGATTREIAEAAGQNIASISYHFGGKEGLYHAVLKKSFERTQERIRDALEPLVNLHSAEDLSRTQALNLILGFVRALYLRVMSRDESLAMTRLIVREQMKPTPAFDLLYQNHLGVVHERLTWLVARVTGSNPKDAATIIRAHSLLGQLYAFCVARETARRRLRWTTLEGKNADAVIAVLEENITRMLPPPRRAKPNRSRS
ncbi:MAG: transcriptional regulator CecR [Chthoniobacteraceae bacterium]